MQACASTEEFAANLKQQFPGKDLLAMAISCCKRADMH